jgi:hypothetical protein
MQRWNGSLLTWMILVRSPSLPDFALELTKYSADIDDAIPVPSGTGADTEPPAESVVSIVEMGFTPKQAKKALKETVRTFPILSAGGSLRAFHA